jgi:hypothetical protein
MNSSTMTADPVAAHSRDGIVPRLAQAGRAFDRALALAGGGHDRLDDAGKAGVPAAATASSKLSAKR